MKTIKLYILTARKTNFKSVQLKKMYTRHVTQIMLNLFHAAIDTFVFLYYVAWFKESKGENIWQHLASLGFLTQPVSISSF